MSIKIEDLTIKQVREIALLVGGMMGSKEDSTRSICERYKGKYVLVRSRMSGINAGVVVEADHTGIILEDARRLWHHRPKEDNECWYEGVANHGLRDDSRISGVSQEKAIIEDYEVIICSSAAEESIRSFKAHKQS